MSATTDIAPARPSATVVLVREAATAPEIFMVKRHKDASFGSAFAFPGGVLEDVDAEVHQYCGDMNDANASNYLGVKESGLDYFVAAIRELFEETGVLLADLSGIDEDLNDIRANLNAGTSSWRDFVVENKLQLHCEQLSYISHWITPAVRAKRYTTRFFVAAMPAGQAAIHCGGELTESRWSSARDTLQAHRDNEIQIHFPTLKSLESLERHESLDSLIDWARSCADWGITSMLPAVISRNGRDQIVLPGDKDYPGHRT